MPPVSVQGFDLDPRIGQGLAGGIQTLGQFRQFGQQNLALQREAGVREALAGGGQVQPAQVGQALVGQPDQALQQPEQAPPLTHAEKVELAMKIDPAIANRQLKAAGLDDASKRAEMSRFAARIELLPFDQRPAEIQRRSQELKNQDRVSTQTDMLLDMDESTQNQALLGIQLMDLTTSQRLDKRGAPAKAVAEEEKVRFDKAKQFRTEAERFEKPFRQREGAIANVRASAEGALAGNTASAISLVFNFFKTIDPASTVREGEVTTAQQAGAGASTRLVNLYNGLIAGDVAMTPDQINNILNDSEGQFASAQKTRDKEKRRLLSTADRFNVEEGDIFGEEPQPTTEGDLTVEEQAELEQLRARAGR